MDPLRTHLLSLLKGGQAFDTFEDLTAEFKVDERGVMPEGAEHSAWQILEHMRITQRDILDFSQNEDGKYEEKAWPKEYWPPSLLPSAEAWDESVRVYQSDREELERLVRDERIDLFKPFPWDQEKTLLREILLAADHAAYHLGELVQLKRWLGSV
jgi:hypothetical protein